LSYGGLPGAALPVMRDHPLGAQLLGTLASSPLPRGAVGNRTRVRASFHLCSTGVVPIDIRVGTPLTPNGCNPSPPVRQCGGSSEFIDRPMIRWRRLTAAIVEALAAVQQLTKLVADHRLRQ